jgi:hypothetical protein
MFPLGDSVKSDSHWLLLFFGGEKKEKRKDGKWKRTKKRLTGKSG